MHITFNVLINRFQQYLIDSHSPNFWHNNCYCMLNDFFVGIDLCYMLILLRVDSILM